MLKLQPALIVTRREVRDQFRDWRIIFPIITLTIFFPALMNFTAREAVLFVGRYGAPLIAERLIPFLLMVVGFFPISFSLVIALESFVGEKERRSIEPLLSSPLTDGQLYLGKLLAAMVPPLLAAYLGIGVYLVGVYKQVRWSPTPQLLTQILLLTTVQAIVMVSGAVVISAQMTSVRAANLLASFIIIPVALLIQAESIVMFWGMYSVLWWAILGLAVVACLLLRTGITHFNREELLGKELDSVNMIGSWRQFKDGFFGKSRNFWVWYRREVLQVVGKMGWPILIMTLLLGTAFLIGVRESRVFVIPTGMLKLENLNEGFVQGLEPLRFLSASSVGMVWAHNLRAILLATVLGIFSFGVLGVIVLMVPFILIGYFVASVASAGIDPVAFFGAFVLPHGIFEIPAMILAGAAILRMGATLAASTKYQSIGSAWLRSLADWTKIMVGLVLPLLIGAAILEVFVTPQIVLLWLGK